MIWCRQMSSHGPAVTKAAILLVTAMAVASPLSAEDAPERGFFGLTPRLVDERVTVVAVTPGGPAEAAGIRTGDVIVLLDGAPPTPTAAGGLGEVFTRFHSGDEVEVVVRREGAIQRVQVTLGTVPPPTREQQERMAALERRKHAAEAVDRMFTTLDAFELTFHEDGRLLFRESEDDEWQALEPEVAETFDAVTRHFLRDQETTILRLKVDRSDEKEPKLVVVDR